MRSLETTVFLASIFIPAFLSGAAEQPKFEVASVKRAKECAFQNAVDPGRIAFHGDPLKVVLVEAFKVKSDDILGPSWLDSDCFSVDATMPPGANKEQVPAMLQALLVERFKIVAHKESRLRSGYALIVDKQVSKLRKSDPNPRSTVPPGDVMFGAGPRLSRIKGSITMAKLAQFVSRRLGAPVEDLTGLNGKYDIDISWVPDRSTEKMGPYAQAYAATHPDSGNDEASLSPGPSDDIFTSLRNTLGLRLEARKEPIEVLVIDHVERIPTEN